LRIKLRPQQEWHEIKPPVSTGGFFRGGNEETLAGMLSSALAADIRRQQKWRAY
jgi:hypothetical protein